MRMGSAQVSPLDFDNLYGLEVLELAQRRARGKVQVRDQLRDGRGRVHSGVYAALAESLVALATAAAVEPEGKIATSLSLQTSFVEPIADGSINAVAEVRHRGRTTWVWEVEISDDWGSLCAFCRATVAVSERSAPA